MKMMCDVVWCIVVWCSLMWCGVNYADFISVSDYFILAYPKQNFSELKTYLLNWKFQMKFVKLKPK